MFKKHSKTTFISAHMAWLSNDLGKLGRLLDEVPNMNVGIGAIIAELGRQPTVCEAVLYQISEQNLYLEKIVGSQKSSLPILES